MRVTGNGPEGGVIDDRFGTAGTGKLVDHVLHGFVIGKALVVVMNGDALAQGFVDLHPEDVVEVRFTAEDQSEAVDGTRGSPRRILFHRAQRDHSKKHGSAVCRLCQTPELSGSRTHCHCHRAGQGTASGKSPFPGGRTTG